MYFVLLYRNRDRINPRVGNTAIALRKRSEDKSLHSIDFLYMYYRPEHWWFEVADALRRVVMTGGLIFAPGNHRATIGFACACFSLVLYSDIAPVRVTPPRIIQSIQRRTDPRFAPRPTVLNLQRQYLGGFSPMAAHYCLFYRRADFVHPFDGDLCRSWHCTCGQHLHLIDPSCVYAVETRIFSAPN